MTSPLLTIGITSYREGDQLTACWQSVLAQTDDRWTAVLVLDGGHDAQTRAIFDALEHPKLHKYAAPENRGPYPMRNEAFALTQTPWHFYLDGDDQLLPDTVALVLAAVQRVPDADIVVGDYVYFDGGSGVKAYPHALVPDDYLAGQPLPGPCAYRTELWQRLGGFAAELARGNGDYDFHIGAAEAGAHIVHCGAPFYRYRLGQSTKVSVSYDRSYHKTHEIMVARHPTFFEVGKRRDRFLALAYVRSAVSNWRAGERAVAKALLDQAAEHGLWRDPWLWRPALGATRRSLFPAGIVRGIQAWVK